MNTVTYTPPHVQTREAGTTAADGAGAPSPERNPRDTMVVYDGRQATELAALQPDTHIRTERDDTLLLLAARLDVPDANLTKRLAGLCSANPKICWEAAMFGSLTPGLEIVLPSAKRVMAWRDDAATRVVNSSYERWRARTNRA